MAIVPDTKDWTWVLERPCNECGFDSSTLSRDAVSPLIRSTASAWLPILDEPAELVRRRPQEDRWSPLEYACHVRDVFALADTRIRLMLTEDHPTFANWDQDATAVDDHYDEQDAGEVARALVVAAEATATRLDGVGGAAWQRAGTRSDGSQFTVETFARYVIHDPVHHLYDVRTDQSAARQEGRTAD